ncbi:MAG: T9SS type A sorting domain-containing protein [Sphingobacteriaceae bacterium]
MHKIGLKFLQTFPCLLIYASVFLPFFSLAQGLINNGAYIVLTDQSTVNIAGTTGHYTNQNGGLIKNSTTGGTINLDGNWINNATNTAFSNDGATVAFKGATAQSIAGTNATGFYNITASGGNTKTFNTVTSTVSRLVTVESSTTLNANNKLRLLSTASSNASVGPLLSGATVTNNVIVESYLTGGRRGSKGFSSPINDALIAGDKTYKQLQSKLIITGPSGTANGFDKGNSGAPYSVTIKTYNEAAPLSASQWTNLSSITQSTTPGKGFFLYFRGNRTSNYNSTGTYATGSKIVGPYATPENVTVEYTGPINQGNINIPLSYTNNGDSDVFRGCNLVGNPYPSVIDWHAVKSASSSGGANISPYIYILRQDGAFATYNSNNPALSTNNGTRYIMPGQAFYVLANTSSQTLTFTETCKDSYPASGTVMRFLSAPSVGKNFGITNSTSSIPSPYSSIKILRFNLENSDVSEETLLAFMNGSSQNFESFEDALYFAGSPVQLSTKSLDDKNLSVNVQPEPTEATEVKLNIGTSQEGAHKLNFTDLSGFAGTQLFLEDNYLNKIENVTAGKIYDFDINSNSKDSYGGNRFKLIFRPSVKLSDFFAKKVYGGSEINWSADNSSKNNLYTIERSTDGQNFKSIGSVQKVTDVKSLYSFFDNKPENGINYYRLKLIESDNTFAHTNIVSVDYSIEDSEPYFQIYPNPVDDILNVLFKQVTKKATLTIYNLSGQKIASFSVSDSNRADKSVSELQPGVYVLKVVDGQNKEVGSEKFIKE